MPLFLPSLLRQTSASPLKTPAPLATAALRLVSRRQWLGTSAAAAWAAALHPLGAAANELPAGPVSAPGAALPAAAAPQPPAAPPVRTQRRVATLMIVGGAEDRLQDRVILRNFVARSGGPAARILVCTAASGSPQAAWEGYQQVFEDLGVAQCEHLNLRHPDEANQEAVVAQILAADGIWIGGGDQRRLMATLWETAAARALHLAFHVRGSHIGGTSAGAAAMSRHMLAIGEAAPRPEKDMVSADIGLGLLSSAIVDQHFSERGRLGRLLSAMAQRPDLLGVGVDEDTALLIERGVGLEVIGSGNVTLVDGRRMDTNFHELGPAERLQMVGVQLHLLPSGATYRLTPPQPTQPAQPSDIPKQLREVLALLVAPGPIRG